MASGTRFEQVDHSLDMDEALHVHAAERPAKLVGGLVILGTVTLSALGLLGDGKLSRVEIDRADASLRYLRVMRLGKEESLELALPGGTEVTIPIEYFRNLKLERIVPEPAATRITDAGVTYIVDNDAPTTMRFYVLPEDAGMVNAVLRINGERFPVRHLILP